MKDDSRTGRIVAKHPTWRRRVGAIAVLMLASGALIATSQPVIQSTLEASHSGHAELTLDAPRVTGRVMLDLSANALPAPRDQRLRVSGTVDFYQRNQNASVRMRVHAVDVEAAPAESEVSTGWPIEQLCRVAEQCQREFEVTFEWLNPEPGTTQRASFEATVRITYDRAENNPEGATAKWTESAAFAPAPGGPVVATGTNPERITLDRAHPAVIRHVTLTASGIADATRTSASVDSSATGTGADAVRFTIIADNPGGGDAGPASSASAIDPFATCSDKTDCVNGVTVMIELTAVEPDASATVDWSLLVQAEFPPATVPPDGAEISAIIDQAVEVGADTPYITAIASGTLEPGPDDSGTIMSFTRIVIATEDAGLQLGSSSALTPPTVGVLGLRAVDDVTVNLHVAGDRGTTYAYQPFMLGPGRSSATVLVYPLPACDAGRDCTVELWLSATTATPVAADTQPVVRVEWDLDLNVFYPGLAAPPDGAQVRIDVSVDDR